MTDFTTVASGLRFPEGPVAMPDGSVIFVEIEAGRITRISPDGTKTTVSEPGGGPNGLAIGPDGKLYCCNNGGFAWREANGFLTPHGQPDDYSGGRIERIDIATGAVEILYKDGDFGCSLRGPNDIVFDSHGGFWFTITENRATGNATSPASSTRKPTAPSLRKSSSQAKTPTASASRPTARGSTRRRRSPAG